MPCKNRFRNGRSGVSHPPTCRTHALGGPSAPFSPCPNRTPTSSARRRQEWHAALRGGHHHPGHPARPPGPNGHHTTRSLPRWTPSPRARPGSPAPLGAAGRTASRTRDRPTGPATLCDRRPPPVHRRMTVPPSNPETPRGPRVGSRDHDCRRRADRSRLARKTPGSDSGVAATPSASTAGGPRPRHRPTTPTGRSATGLGTADKGASDHRGDPGDNSSNTPAGRSVLGVHGRPGSRRAPPRRDRAPAGFAETITGPYPTSPQARFPRSSRRPGSRVSRPDTPRSPCPPPRRSQAPIRPPHSPLRSAVRAARITVCGEKARLDQRELLPGHHTARHGPLQTSSSGGPGRPKSPDSPRVHAPTYPIGRKTVADQVFYAYQDQHFCGQTCPTGHHHPENRPPGRPAWPPSPPTDAPTPTPTPALHQEQHAIHRRWSTTYSPCGIMLM